MLCDIQETRHHDELNKLVESLFNSNVVIAKGANRHPYADVLHEWIEGSDMEYYDPMFEKWYSNSKVEITFNSTYKYRIKPQEPVYEYMYYDKEGRTDWMTIEEVEQCVYKDTFIQAKETKRIRK